MASDGTEVILTDEMEKVAAEHSGKCY